MLQTQTTFHIVRNKLINKVLSLYQRMHKFKFEPPQQHRRSLHPKNQNVTVINLLQKCTQIVREDRLWLRNEIKNNRAEVLEIFKNYPKPSQLQHLQIKLRKYVQTIKAQVKNQQLNRFKESLRTNIMSNSFLPDNNKSQFKQIPSSNSRQSTFKHNSSVEFNRTTNPRFNKSQNHNTSSTSFNMNRSMNNFQDLLQGKYNQQIIEQRESENVTSARLGRQQTEPSKTKSLLKQQKFDSYEHRVIEPRKQWHKKGQQKYDLPNFLKFSQNIDLKQPKPTKYQIPQFPQPWQFQKKAKTVLYQYQQEPQIKNNHLQISNQSNVYDDKEQSIFDQHFNQSNKSITQLDQIEYPTHTFVNQFKNSNFNSKETINKPVRVLSQVNSNEAVRTLSANVFGNPLRETQFKNTDGEVILFSQQSSSKKVSQPQVEQTLFTAPELLNECRNFLKHRDSSIKKQMMNNDTDKKDIPQTILTFPILSQQFSPQCLFSRNNIKDESIKTEPVQQTRKQEQDENYPEINQSNFQKTSLWDQNNKQQLPVINYDTFSNHSISNLASPKLPNSLINTVTPKVSAVNQLPLNFSIEEFLEELMNLTEMSFCIDKQSFLGFISKQQNCSLLKSIFTKLIASKSEIFLTQIAVTLNNFINETNDKQYPHNDPVINSVYDLLDINQKDYIDKDDIESFLQQIEQAQVDNSDLVCESLWRLFDGADFSNDQKLTYWHLYIVKNSEQFSQVSKLLSEFEFEIERT